MPNDENLIRNSELTPDERKARASKAGKASGAARRRRKKMKIVLESLMTLPPNSQEAQAALEGLGELLEDADNQTALLAGLMKKAMTGDTKAVQEIRNILGESRDVPEKKKEQKAQDDGFLAALNGKAGDDWAGN